MSNSYQYGSSCARATAGRRSEANLTPPLPLVRFELSKEVIEQGPKTINREDLRSIPNDLSGDYKNTPPDKLHDPITSRRLAKWFVARSQKEINYRQSELYAKYVNEASVDDGISTSTPTSDMFEYVVYESLMHQESKEERQRRNERRPTEEQIHTQRYQQQQAAASLAAAVSTGGSRRKRVSTSTAKEAIHSKDTNKIATEDIVPIDTETNNIICVTGDDESVGSINSASHSETTVSRNDSTSTPTIHYTPSLIFDAEFESGNLERATRVIGRENLLPSKALEHLQEYQAPEDVDQEYDLVIRNDIYTEGNIQWYYFCVSFDQDLHAQYQQQTMSSESQPPSSSQFLNNGISFPFRVRFNIVNMQKKDSLYNYGMKPAVLSIHENHLNGKDWFHHGHDICYYKNGLNQLQASVGGISSSSSSTKGEKRRKLLVRNHYTLTFSYTFDRPDTVYFAHTFPYTYSDLQRFLQSTEMRLQTNDFFHRRILCETIAGNRCDVLTITERAEGVLESKTKPAVIVSARVHPGECNSSFMIQGLIEYLCSDSPEAIKLRKTFIFTIVPMLNPDGVVHGNYRCSLAGTDLNRRYSDANEAMHPTVVAMKDMIKNIKQNRPIALYLDLHGHSRQKNSFIYGCDITMQPDKISQVLLSNLPEEELNLLRLHCRIFPKILCTLSKAANPASGTGVGFFSYRDCAFKVQKSKMGTGRVVCWRDLGILGSYTIEASFCGNGNNMEFSLFRKYWDSLFSRSAKLSPSMPISESTSGKGGEITLASTSCDNSFCNTDHGCSSNAGGSTKTALNTPSSSSKRNFSGIDSYISKADVDPTFQEILKGYKSYTHYQKKDLLMMGKHIAQAVYHYANLTHADLAYELEQLRAQNELEIKTRVGSANGMRSWSSGGGSPIYGRISSQTSPSTNVHSKLSKTTDDIASLPASKGFSSGNSFMLANNKGNSQGGIAFCDHDGSMRSNGSFDPFMAIEHDDEDVKDLHGDLDDELDHDENADPDHEIDNENETGSDCSLEEFLRKKPASDQETFVYRSGSNSSKYSSKALAAAAAKAAIEEVLVKYRSLRISLFETNMIGRLLPHFGIFSSEAIQYTLQNYCNEYTVDRSTKNIGLRIKCELALRRMLKIDRQLNLERLITTENELKRSRDDEEEVDMGSDDGSDSNPSGDNQNASKLLKNMKRYKDTNSLVAALRNALLKKKKKEDERAKKQEKKMLARLVKQAELAKKQQLETERQEKLNQAKDARRKASQAASAALNQLQQKNKSSRSANTLAAPKYTAPLYRLAPEAKVSVPVQIKMMSFKDYDTSSGTPTKRGGMEQGRRQTFASTNIDTPASTLFSNANPNIANILGFGGGNNANIMMPKVGNSVASDNLVDLLPGLCIQPESGPGHQPKEDTPFAAALRLKNAIVNNRDDDHTQSPRPYAGNGSGRVRPATRANYSHHNPLFPSSMSSPEKIRLERPSSSPGLRKVSHFSNK